MIEFTTDKVSWASDETGMKLTLWTPQAKEIADSMERGKDYSIKISEKGKGRSLNANSYLWAILSQCADVLGTTKEELYIDYVRKCGPYRDFSLSEDTVNTFCIAWSKMGTGWPTERVDFDGDNVIVRAYYGSSTYNTRQMARLLDMVIEDAKEIGVDVMTEKERSLLLDKWKPVEV